MLPFHIAKRRRGDEEEEEEEYGDAERFNKVCFAIILCSTLSALS